MPAKKKAGEGRKAGEKKKIQMGEEEADGPPSKKTMKIDKKKSSAVIGVKKGGKVKNRVAAAAVAAVAAQEEEIVEEEVTTGGQDQAALVPLLVMRSSPRFAKKTAAGAKKAAAAAAGGAAKKRGRPAQATKSRSRSRSRSGSRSSSEGVVKSVTSPEESEESAIDEEQDGTSAGTTKKRGRKPTVHLTREQEIEAIEFVKANPCFYDKSDDQWFQQSALDYKWEHLVKSLKKYSYQELLQWWNSFRTRYGKVKKKKDKSGSGVVHLTEREEFVYSHGNFLYAHIRQQVNRKPTNKIRKKLALTPMDDDEPDAQVVAGVEENPGKYIFIFLFNVSSCYFQSIVIHVIPNTYFHP